MKLALLVVLAGCDWSLHRMQDPVGCTVHGTTDLLPNDSCDLTAPAGTVSMVPVAPTPPLTRTLLVRGRDRYERICAACHGLRGDGESPVATSMTLRRPPSLIDPTATGLSDQRIQTVIEVGYGLMPAYQWISAADRYAIFHYVRALQQREVSLDALAPTLRAEAVRWLR